MKNNISVHGDPDTSVFGLHGNHLVNDQGKLFLKKSGDSRNVGWKQILPTPTPTNTVTITPSKTMIVTRTPTNSSTQQYPDTPTQTPTVTETPFPSYIPGSSPTPTKTVTNTPFRDLIKYTLYSSFGGSVLRIDGPSPTGLIARKTGSMVIQALVSSGFHFAGWSAPEYVSVGNPYSLYTTATGFDTYEDVIIIGNFGVGLLPTYKVDGISAGSTGELGKINFFYIKESGEEAEYYADNLPIGATLTNIVCANRITSVVIGTPILTQNRC